MKENKINIFLLITSILSISILVIGGTFSYFSLRTMSKMNAIAVEAGKVKIGLGVSPVYTGHPLIPTNDSDIIKAYNQKCLDDYQNGACLAYGLEIFNFHKSESVIGKIDFTVEGIENLSYMVLDENNNVYLDKTSIKGTTNGMSLGPSFILADASGTNPISKKFTLLIWLTNINKDQTDMDAGGKFSAVVTYESIYGGKLTATVEGYEKEGNDTAQIGDVS
ncbi:MAG: hypothetical protein IJZ46_04495 [Bacilli bacterium]|nr:hypothetical protein [Bacilli bacterium]